MGTTPQNWLFAIGGAVLTALAVAAKDWLGGKLKLLLEFLYGRFAGSRLLRRAALAKYTRELYRRHKEFPVSFQVDEALRLPMESVYVPLHGANGNGSGDLLEAALRRARRTVVLGTPGAGKTMLLRHETLMWARRRIREGRRRVDLGELRDIPVLFELHRLNKGEGSGLEEHLSDHFKRHGFPRADKWVAGALDRGDLTLYFDGLDEVTTDRRERVVGMIKDFADTYPECRIVVTCRVAVYEGQFTEFHQTLRVQDFDEHLIRRFLGGWPWQAGTAVSSVDQLLGALRNTPQIMSLARNPLLLTMIAYLYDFVYAGTDQVLPHTRADFYKQVIDNLLVDRRRRSEFPYPVKRAVLRHLALVAQDVPSGAHDRLALPAETVVAKTRAVLEQQGRDTALAEAVLTEIVERSGLLLAVDNGERYQFAHLTLQEYLAAEILAADPGGLLDRYRADPPAWREAVRLWCGAEARDCTEAVRAVFEHDPVLAFQCLADAHTVDDDLAEAILTHFRRRLAQAGDAEIAAFGLVAGDRRRRGVEVFEYLREVVAAAAQQPTGAGWWFGRDLTRTQAAARALAATHLPQAAEALAGLAASPGTPAWEALGLMGDLAVPHFEAMAPTIPEAYRMLWAIRTPKAALALNRLMWAEEALLAHLERYFYLGELLTVPEIAAELRSAPTKGGDVLHWVWRPFAEGPGDALARIAGRIACALREATAEELRRDLPAPDPRISAALAVIAEPDGRGIAPLVAVPEELLTGVLDIHPSMQASVNDAEREINTRDLGRRLGLLLFPASAAVDKGVLPPMPARALRASVALLQHAGLPPRRQALLTLLPPWLRLRAAVALLSQPSPAHSQTWDSTPRDPRKPVVTFGRSWHARFMVLVWALLNGVATWRAVSAGLGDRPWGPEWLAWVAVAVIVVGWPTTVALMRDVLVHPAWTIPLLAALVTVSFYAYVAAMQPWGVLVTTGAAVTIAACCFTVLLHGIYREDRDTALSHPVRHLVLDPLLPRT